MDEGEASVDEWRGWGWCHGVIVFMRIFHR